MDNPDEMAASLEKMVDEAYGRSKALFESDKKLYGNRVKKNRRRLWSLHAPEGCWRSQGPNDCTAKAYPKGIPCVGGPLTYEEAMGLCIPFPFMTAF